MNAVAHATCKAKTSERERVIFRIFAWATLVRHGGHVEAADAAAMADAAGGCVPSLVITRRASCHLICLLS